MKRAVIIHCWEGYPKYCWYQSIKAELEKEGFKVKIPAFPDSERPKLKNWLSYLKSTVRKPDENLFLIGHSIGCATILRYLESLKEGERIGGAVFVAGFVNNLGFKELSNFFKKPINFKKARMGMKKGSIAIYSTNDPFVPLDHAEVFKKKLGSEVIMKKNMGHFSGPIEEEVACLELPDVVKSVKKLSGK